MPDDRALDIEYRLQKVTQLVLRQRYPELVPPDAAPDEIRGNEFGIHSQEGIDGILFRRPYRCRHAQAASLTRENVNQIVARGGMTGEIDLLSIDIDGNDYGIWRELSEVPPRVVVVEYNASFGPDRAATVPYDADFHCFRAHPSGFYHGASLAALTKLGQAKGYALIGVESQGVNAIFLRQDLAAGVFPALDPRRAYVPHLQRGKIMAQSEQYALILGQALETV